MRWPYLPGGQNNPVVEAIDNVKLDGMTVTFEAHSNFGKEPSVTDSPLPLPPRPAAHSADDFAAAILFGPGLIEVN
jgi:hypothetical protein